MGTDLVKLRKEVQVDIRRETPVIQRTLKASTAAVRRLTSMVFRRAPFRIFSVRGSTVDWQRAVGDGTSSSTVMAPILWISRTFPEAPPALWRQLENGQEEQERNHDLLRLLQRPNPFYTGPVMWMATLTDWTVDGNAHWLKIRNNAGRVEQLWWVPHWMIEPKSDENDNTVFISHYEYTVEGFEPRRIPVEDVVHFRFGMDADDPRKGYSPLKSVLREVYTDDEAALFTASLLRNMGVPGVLVSPEGSVGLNAEDAKATKEYFKEAFTGDRRGEPLVMAAPTKINQFGFSPEQLVLRDIRRIPEERVTAVLGVPAIVAGLGAGLDRSTFTNMAEAREAAYESGIIPTQRILAEDIRFQLLNDFEEDVFPWRFGFDLSKVRVLEEDALRQARRHDLMIRGGWETRAEGRRALGLDVDDERDNVFLVPSNYITTHGEVTPTEEPPAEPPMLQAVAELSAHVQALGMKQPETDPALLTLMAEVATAVTVTAKQAGEPRPADPELVAVLTALAAKDNTDPGYAKALEGLAEAVRESSSDQKLLAVVSSIADRKPSMKTIEWNDDHTKATVIEELVA